MNAVQRSISLMLAAAGAVLVPMAAALERGEILEQMKRRRPADLRILDTRPGGLGDTILGMFALSGDPADPDLRRYKLWIESSDDLVIPTESVNCSTDSPMRVTRDGAAIYVRRLNPGGTVNPGNRNDHLVWWAACVPDQAGLDPATLTDAARALGFSTLLVEFTETLRLP